MCWQPHFTNFFLTWLKPSPHCVAHQAFHFPLNNKLHWRGNTGNIIQSYCCCVCILQLLNTNDLQISELRIIYTVFVPAKLTNISLLDPPFYCITRSNRKGREKGMQDHPQYLLHQEVLIILSGGTHYTLVAHYNQHFDLIQMSKKLMDFPHMANNCHLRFLTPTKQFNPLMQFLQVL